MTKPIPYRIDVARDGDLYSDTVWAASRTEAEALAFDKVCHDWNLDAGDYPDGWDDLVCDLDGADVIPDAQPFYRHLADGLSDMIEEGRLTEAMVPADYRWIVALLVKIAGVDPAEPATPMADVRAHAEDYDANA